MSVSAVYLTTTHDTHGNPRRGWLITESDDETYFEDEGYGGVDGVLRHRGMYLRQALEAAPEVRVAPAEWKRIRKQYR